MKGKFGFGFGILLVFAVNSCTVSEISLEKFRERFNEIQRDGSFYSTAEATYAAGGK
jgi:hypothetical protein